MRILLFFLLFSFTLVAYPQVEFYLESYPTKQELVRLNAMSSYARPVQEYTDEDGFRCSGVLKFFKKGRDIDIRPVGDWKHFYPSGKVKEAVLYNEKGQVKEVFAFNKGGSFVSDSRYTYKKHHGITYRIETYTVYNTEGTPQKIEYWYNRISFKSAFLHISAPKRIGIWKKFDEKGLAIVDKKEYKAKLAVNLGVPIG